MRKTIACLLAVLSIFSIISITVCSVEAVYVEPRWNNTNSATVSLAISDTGKATISLVCNGKSGVTTGITGETKLERKWGLFWLDVDGGEWTDTTTNWYLSRTHNIQLSKTGTYRATTEYTVTGSGGTNDVISCECEYTYD